MVKCGVLFEVRTGFLNIIYVRQTQTVAQRASRRNDWCLTQEVSNFSAGIPAPYVI
jgi:hypothetical protein